MTNDELNEYIKHYIEKDRTGRAIMLSGPWGVGKSFYIRNCLVPFLKKPQNGEHQCIVISLYGISELSEISKSIYLEARVKRINLESEAGKTAVFAAKTVLKGIAGHFGIDLSADERGLQELYQSIDLTGKLLVFEDVERANINISSFLGYVNSLVEQDGVKVLLVTNEDELLRYKPITESDPDKKKFADLLEKTGKYQVREYTKDTLQYLATKEKSVGDTITFSGDLTLAVKQIIQLFNHNILNRFATDNCATDIVDIMILRNSFNLRSIIFACQKTVDIYDFFPEDSDFSDDFIKTIFNGIVFFSLQLHAGSKARWIGLESYSLELGSSIYPLFRFCFDYITEQQLDVSCFSEAEIALKKMRLYDRNKTSKDPDIRVICGYYLYSEREVLSAVESITHRLANLEDISFFDYGKIAVGLVAAKYDLGINIEKAKERIIANLEKQDGELTEEDLFVESFANSSEDARIEYNRLRDDMINALHRERTIIPNFNYLPEQTSSFKSYVYSNREKYYKIYGFAKYLDIKRIVDLYSRCTASQMNDIRDVFRCVYSTSNVKEFLQDDKCAVEELLKGIEMTWERPEIDKVQLLQYRWFIDTLKDICNRLS